MWETHPEEWAAWDHELQWAAGLFEGEGCITISGTQARVKLNMTDEDVVRRFHGAVEVGHVREEYGQLRKGHKLQWEWYTGKQEDVLHVLEVLKPRLGERRRARAEEIERHVFMLEEADRLRRVF